MKKIISYVLFGNEGRYWGNISYILVANSAIYPDFNMRFYIHRESTELPGFLMLRKMSESFPTIEIEILDDVYVGTKLTNWRMKPLWEDDVDILLCRDLDHITNMLERKAVQYFLNHSEHYIMGIRSYSLHTTPYMAGLCGFRCPKIRGEIRGIIPTFDDYIKWGTEKVSYCKDWRWGCDQALLRDFFNHVGMYGKSLDCPQFTASLKISQFEPKTVVPGEYCNEELPNCSLPALNYSDSIAPGFTGAPTTATTNQILDLIKIVNNEMGRMVRPYV
jgi:hypothetical protein